eukprot:134986-Pleurochrysis_carterae.AAC.1
MNDASDSRVTFTTVEGGLFLTRIGRLVHPYPTRMCGKLAIAAHGVGGCVSCRSPSRIHAAFPRRGRAPRWQAHAQICLCVVQTSVPVVLFPSDMIKFQGESGQRC